MKRFYILTFLYFLTGLTVSGQKGRIEGQVYDRREKKGLAYAIVLLVDTKITAITDINGNFIIDNVPIGTYSLTASFIGYGDTTLTNVQVISDTTIVLKFVLPIFCAYDKSRDDKTCPICGRKDKVVPIVYGLPIGKMNNKKKYYAGCTVTPCDQHWYCRRDKYKF
jgi:hypothetical protein